jgi:hypothetical protein
VLWFHPSIALVAAGPTPLGFAAFELCGSSASRERASARSAATLISALLNSRAPRRGLYFIGGCRSLGSLLGIVADLHIGANSGHVGSDPLSVVRFAHDLFLSVENSYSPSFRNCELVLLNGLHHSSKKSNPFADHPTYRNRLSMVKSFPRNTEGFAVGNVELAHRRSPIGRLSWWPRPSSGRNRVSSVPQIQ